MKKLLLTALLAVLAGCATIITMEQWQSADFGKKLAKAEYLDYIKQDVRRSLIDPNSMIIECNDGKKGWAKENRLYNPQFGWVVYCEVNARNRFGGYTGSKSYIYLFNGDRVLVRIPSGYADRGDDYDYMP